MRASKLADEQHVPQAVDQRVVGQISDPWTDGSTVVVQTRISCCSKFAQLPGRLVERRACAASTARWRRSSAKGSLPRSRSQDIAQSS